MTTQIIGRVMMAFKGNYDATKQYNFLDTVTYNGSSYVCLVNGTTAAPSDSSSNWQMMAKAGTTPDTSQFALKSELPDLTAYAKKSELPTVPTDLVRTSDLQTVSETASEALDKANSNAKTLMAKANKSDIPTTMAWNSITDKPNLVTKDELPKVEGYQVKTVTSGQLADLTTGTYEIDFAAEDAPSINWGVLQVLVGDHYAQQIFSNAGATNGASQTWIRTRNYDESNYDAWQEVSLPNTTDWSSTGITYLNGAKSNTDNSMLKCRVVSIGNIHIVELKGWFTAGNLGNHNFLPQVQVPAFGFENDDYYFESKGSVTSYDSFIQVDSNAKCQIDLYSYSTQNGPSIPLNAMWIY